MWFLIFGMGKVSDVLVGNSFPVYLYLIHLSVLFGLKTDTNGKIGSLRVGIERQLRENWQCKSLIELDLFVSSQGEVGNVEFIGVCTFPRGKTNFCRPIQSA